MQPIRVIFHFEALNQFFSDTQQILLYFSERDCVTSKFIREITIHRSLPLRQKLEKKLRLNQKYFLYVRHDFVN